MSGLRPGQLAWILAWAWLGTGAAALRAQVAVREGFETPEVTWRAAGGDARIRLLTHERTGQGAHSGHGSEFLAFEAAAGATTLYFEHNLGRAPVISELKASVWVLSDRPGTQVLARVVFPRSVDPRSQAPAYALVRGPVYQQVGDWQQLVLEDLPTLVTRAARVLRSELRADVDLREAFVDQLLLNVYSGGGRTRLWIDDLALDGQVQTQPANMAMVSLASPPPAARPVAELNGSVFLVDGRPFFPRAIEYQGEPLALLRDLGFNAVKFPVLPPPELLAEAQRVGLSVICPPPRPAGLDQPEAAVPSTLDIGPEYNGVVAWDMGRKLNAQELAPTRRWVEQLRRADGRMARPVICEADVELRAYSRLADVLVLRRLPLGTSFELADFGTWLSARPRSGRPGTPTWAVIQTQPAPQLREQWKLLSGSAANADSNYAEQIRLLAYVALASGTRGLCFENQTPLSAPDEATRSRAAVLELLNLELQLIEPWAAAGNVAGRVQGIVIQSQPGPVPQALTPQARSDANKSGIIAPVRVETEVGGAVLQIDRGQLLLPIWTASGGQFVPGQSAGNSLSFVVPGVPESHDVQQITPAGLRPARHQRVSGGIRVTLDEFSMTSMVILTQDPQVIGGISQRLARSGARAAQLEHDLAMRKLQFVTEIHNRLAAAGHTVKRAEQRIDSAQTSFRACDASLAAGDIQEASAQARRTLRPLAQLEREQWLLSVKNVSSPVSNPLTASFFTLPDYWRFEQQVKIGRWGRNRLAEGDFEDLDRMMWSGWQHFEHPQTGVRTTAELSRLSSNSGMTSLRLAAKAIDLRATAGVLETPPVWITSPPVEVQAGQWLRISGYVHIPDAVTGSLDGLVIFDSVGGEPLAERIGEASSWKPFTLLRAIPKTGTLTLTMALTGYGEAWIDDVKIEVWLPPGTPREPPVPTRGGLTRLPPAR